MSGIDPQYVADAVAWSAAWAGLGLVGRQLLAQHAMRQRTAERRKMKS